MSALALRSSLVAPGISDDAALIRTSSNRLIAAAIWANVPGIEPKQTGQVSRLCGHESHIASWLSHSAGIAILRSAECGLRIALYSGISSPGRFRSLSEGIQTAYDD